MFPDRVPWFVFPKERLMPASVAEQVASSLE